PFVSYGEVGKVDLAAAPRIRASGGTVTAPIGGTLTTLEPSIASTNEPVEVIPNIFETLTRLAEGARIAPWLASDVESENGGLRFRVRLRRGVRFHDGRGLTSRDVRYSMERVLLNRASATRWLLSPIRGARAILEGTATELT